MHSGVKKAVYSGIFFVSMFCNHITFCLQYGSFEQYKERSFCLEKKMKWHRGLNACVTTVATVYTCYSLWNFFMSPEMVRGGHGLMPASTAPAAKVARTWSMIGTNIMKSGLSFATVCAQHMCAQWIITHIISDFSAKNFVKERLSAKEHVLEIKNILKKLNEAASEFTYTRSSLLIQFHLQKIVDKIELLMVYVLACSRSLSSDIVNIPQEVEHFVQVTHEILVRDITIFDQSSDENFIAASNTILTSLTDLLASSIRYTVCLCDMQ